MKLNLYLDKYKDIDYLSKNNVSGVQYFVDVQVGPPKIEKDGIDKYIFD